MIEPLPLEALALGSDPSLLVAELKYAIQERINANPRSAQVEIGASEIGTPCTRKLVYKLGNVLPARKQETRWPMAVGTIIHADLAEMLESLNYSLVAMGSPARWAVETEVEIGTFGQRVLRGHVDVYDRITCSVLDWKNLGITSIRKVKRDAGPGQTYRVQVQCYGRGLANQGLPVERVHVLALPSGGDLDGIWHWSEPYNPAVSEWALNRAFQLTQAAEQIGYGKLAALSATREDYCDSCPWFTPHSADPERGRCPGSDEIQRERQMRAAKPAPLAFSR